jgi:hypothetical protein
MWTKEDAETEVLLLPVESGGDVVTRVEGTGMKPELDCWDCEVDER